jgi:hypothetical protein
MFKLEDANKKSGKLTVRINGETYSGDNKQDLINKVLTIREKYNTSFDNMLVDLEIVATDMEEYNG